MTAHRPPARAGRPRRWRRLAVVAPVLTALLVAPAAPAAGEPPPPPPTGPTAMPAGATGGNTHAVTLLTGDIAMLHTAPDGGQAAWLAEPATDDGRPAQIFERDGQVHVIPAEAQPYLNSGVLDQRLFNLTALVDQGYDDRTRDDLPLLLAGSGEHTGGDIPDGASPQRELPSIDAVSVSADKEQLRTVWESLRGDDPAELGATDATLAMAEKVWLNGRAEVTLGDSVGQVGAPAAWDAGFDGTGVAVAVLDTGYDPHHPDLAGRITGAANFTEDQDPPGETAVDGQGHGTHVAATIAGTGDASDGARTGVAPGADLLIGKVLSDAGFGFDDWIIAGMEWAVDEGATVVNMSLGTPFPSDGTDPLSQAVNNLTEESGTLFVIAAGNDGPGEQTVGSPGAADLALTVGAATKDGSEAWFSSRGPRLNDRAVKPEIVAPGVDIIAARADGTSLGSLLDEHYTSMSGTSMATPHVAGAAAILAQQHPDLDAAGLKAHLVATSSPHDDQPVHFQGSGHLDVVAATTTAVTVSHGSLSFGTVGESGTATRTLTYHNHSDQAVTLRLATEVTSTGVRADRKPVLRARPGALVIPPGGEASAEIELDVHASRPAEYAGHITATDQRNRSVTLHTVMSAAVEGPLRTVTVTGVDRHGDPAEGPVDLWSAETGAMTRVWLSDGEATAEVPDGLYTVLVALSDSSSTIRARSHTVGGDPELQVRRDLDLHYDARDAEPVEVHTDQVTRTDHFQVLWHREVGDRAVSVFGADGTPETELFLLPSPPARTGDFEFVVSWREAQPLLEARLGGPDGAAIEPHPHHASIRLPYTGEETLPVVYAGAGEPDDFAQVDADGKVALVARPDEEWLLSSRAEAAAEAGAALLLVHNTDTYGWINQTGGMALPTYLVDQATGTAIRAALDDDPDTALELVGRSDATYTYEVAFVEHGAVPAGRIYDVTEEPMATVESDYRQNSEGMGTNERWVPYPGSIGISPAPGLTRNGPVVRTEHVSTDNVRWQRLGHPHGEFPGSYGTESPVLQFEPGQTYHQLWWGPLARPGVPAVTGWEEIGMPVARFHDAIRILMPHHLQADGTIYHFIEPFADDVAELTLRRDGAVVGTRDSFMGHVDAQFTVPAAEADFELEMRVQTGSFTYLDTSVSTTSTWQFRSGRPDDGQQVLPLVQLDYHLETDSYNRVPGDTPYGLGIAPGYQPGASGPGGFTVTVEVSYDDGDTWQSAPVAADADAVEATVPAADGDAEFASVRVVATDADGNSLTQEITRGWALG